MICSMHVLEPTGEGGCCSICSDPGGSGCASDLICVDSCLCEDCSGICVKNEGNF